MRNHTSRRFQWVARLLLVTIMVAWSEFPWSALMAAPATPSAKPSAWANIQKVSSATPQKTAPGPTFDQTYQSLRAAEQAAIQAMIDAAPFQTAYDDALGAYLDALPVEKYIGAPSPAPQSAPTGKPSTPSVNPGQKINVTSAPKSPEKIPPDLYFEQVTKDLAAARANLARPNEKRDIAEQKVNDLLLQLFKAAVPGGTQDTIAVGIAAAISLRRAAGMSFHTIIPELSSKRECGGDILMDLKLWDQVNALVQGDDAGVLAGYATLQKFIECTDLRQTVALDKGIALAWIDVNEVFTAPRFDSARLRIREWLFTLAALMGDLHQMLGWTGSQVLVQFYGDVRLASPKSWVVKYGLFYYDIYSGKLKSFPVLPVIQPEPISLVDDPLGVKKLPSSTLPSKTNGATFQEAGTTNKLDALKAAATAGVSAPKAQDTLSWHDLLTPFNYRFGDLRPVICQPQVAFKMQTLKDRTGYDIQNFVMAADPVSAGIGDCTMGERFANGGFCRHVICGNNPFGPDLTRFDSDGLLTDDSMPALKVKSCDLPGAGLGMAMGCQSLPPGTSGAGLASSGIGGAPSSGGYSSITVYGSQNIKKESCQGFLGPWISEPGDMEPASDAGVSGDDQTTTNDSTSSDSTASDDTRNRESKNDPPYELDEVDKKPTVNGSTEYVIDVFAKKKTPKYPSADNLPGSAGKLKDGSSSATTTTSATAAISNPASLPNPSSSSNWQNILSKLGKKVGPIVMKIGLDRMKRAGLAILSKGRGGKGNGGTAMVKGSPFSNGNGFTGEPGVGHGPENSGKMGMAFAEAFVAILEDNPTPPTDYSSLQESIDVSTREAVIAAIHTLAIGVKELNTPGPVNSLYGVTSERLGLVYYLMALSSALKGSPAFKAYIAERFEAARETLRNQAFENAVRDAFGPSMKTPSGRDFERDFEDAYNSILAFSFDDMFVNVWQADRKELGAASPRGFTGQNKPGIALYPLRLALLVNEFNQKGSNENLDTHFTKTTIHELLHVLRFALNDRGYTYNKQFISFMGKTHPLDTSPDHHIMQLISDITGVKLQYLYQDGDSYDSVNKYNGNYGGTGTSPGGGSGNSQGQGQSGGGGGTSPNQNCGPDGCRDFCQPITLKGELALRCPQLAMKPTGGSVTDPSPLSDKGGKTVETYMECLFSGDATGDAACASMKCQDNFVAKKSVSGKCECTASGKGDNPAAGVDWGKFMNDCKAIKCAEGSTNPCCTGGVGLGNTTKTQVSQPVNNSAGLRQQGNDKPQPTPRTPPTPSPNPPSPASKATSLPAAAPKKQYVPYQEPAPTPQKRQQAAPKGYITYPAGR